LAEAANEDIWGSIVIGRTCNGRDAPSRRVWVGDPFDRALISELELDPDGDGVPQA